MITRISLDLRGLQLADHRLSITVCHRHLPTASREMNHRLGRQTRHQRPVAGRSRDPRSPAYAYLDTAPPAWHGSWHGVPDSSSSSRAISATSRAIGAASAYGERDRTYG